MRNKRLAIPHVNKHTLALLGVLLLAVGILTFSSSNSPGSPYGSGNCRFPTNSIDPIYYRFFSVRWYNEVAFAQGEERWNATSAPGEFQEHSFHWDPHINVTDEYVYGSNTYAFLVEPSCVGGYWSGNEVEIRFNLFYYNYSTQGMVASHELGHAYGLPHYGGCNLMNSTITTINNCNISGPTSIDVQRAQALY